MKTRSKKGAADYLVNRDDEVRIILAELAESTGVVAFHWSLAVVEARRDRASALKHLVDSETRLTQFVRLEVTDALSAIRAAISRLETELATQDAPGS